jgi:septal ring factor EnvC (AmiA/AmiB activator)
VDKLADYEDELQKLKTSQTMNQPSSANPDDFPPPNSTRGSGGSSVLASTQNRLSSFLAARKSSPHLAKDASTQPELSTQELQRALSQEQKLRQKAEGQLSQASGELEELSASLFQQANEMVATERKARAKLEERVLVLEKRDGEKRVRLERLEKAVARIERVRGVLAGGPGQ